MPHRFQFNEPVLRSVVGGKSTLDLPRLYIRSPEDASSFILGYGFDLTKESDQKKLWYFHRRALVFLEEKLGFKTTDIPEILRDPKQLGDIRQLLLLASGSKASELQNQRWACSILRVMHVFMHSENDLFSTYSEEIQKQILGPFQNCIYHEGATGKSVLRGKNSDGDPLPLISFEIKPFKTSASTVIKLLARADALAMNVYDKLGVRFVTSSMFDAYRVVRFLVDENLISFPHIMPDQSSNNIYPVDLFVQVADELQAQNSGISLDVIDEVFKKRLSEQKAKVEYLRKENNFSGADYRFIKFIARKLVRIELGEGKGGFSFFFPYEIQIMDNESHQRILSGPEQHQAYKERQRQAARLRVYPEGSATS